jgi:hypothetical protein
MVAGASASSGAPKYKRLGEDAELDAPPGLDLTYLEVAKVGKAVDMRFGISGMFPPGGGYPLLPGIEWTFTTGPRTFVAEAVATTNTTGAFYLFEVKPDGSFVQLESPTGTYNYADGFASVRVPLKAIGAKRGTTLRGAHIEGPDGDVDAHVHVGPLTHYADAFHTESAYKIP